MSNYRLEVIWNREFRWCPFGDAFETVEEAKKFAVDANGERGERIKDARVIEIATGVVKWSGYP